MKLPTFQAQDGTSMGSAMTSPARVGNIKERIPVTKRLAATRDVRGELALGLQKSRTALMVGKAIGDLATVTMEIDDAKQTQSSNAAVGKYNTQMAAYEQQLSADRYQIDEATGKKMFEVMPEKVAEYSKLLKDQIRQEFEFSNRKAENNWSAKTSAYEGAYANKAQGIYNDESLNQTVTMAEYALATTYDPDEAKDIIQGLADDGAMNPDLAPQKFEEWMVNISYKGETKAIQTSSSLDGLAAARTQLENPTANYSQDQINSLERDISRQIANINIGNARAVRSNNGSVGQSTYINELNECGIACTKAKDLTEHDAIIKDLWGVYNTAEKHADNMKSGQGVANTAERFFGNGTYVHASGDKAKLSKATQAMAEADDFMTNGDIQQDVTKSALRGQVTDPFTYRLSTELTSGQSKPAFERIKSLIAINSGSITLKGEAADKYDFYEAMPDSLTAVELEDKWAVYRDIPQDERQIRETAAKKIISEDIDNDLISELKAIENERGIEGLFTEGKDLSITDDGYEYTPSVEIKADPKVEVEARSVFETAYVMTGNKNHALAATWSFFDRKYTSSMLTGERTLERNPPEMMVVRPLNAQGMPVQTDPEFRRSLDGQMATQVEGINALREELGIPPIDAKFTSLVYNPNSGDTQEWYVLNKYGDVVTHPTATNPDNSEIPITFKFSALPSAENAAAVALQRDAEVVAGAEGISRGIASLNKQIRFTNLGHAGISKEEKLGEYKVMDSNIQLDEFMDFSDVNDARRNMVDQWDSLRDDQKAAANADWEYNFKKVMGGMIDLGITDEPTVRLNVERYLFTRGYMKAGKTLDEMEFPVGIEKGYVPEEYK